MAAIAYPLPHERLGSSRRLESPQSPPARPPADDHPSCPRARRRSRPSRAVLFRRRLMAVLLVGGLVLAVRALLLPGGDPLVVPGRATPAAAEAGKQVYVVQAGDTLWSIARRLHPDADPRPMVDELVAQVGGGSLQPGQRIVLP